MVTDDPYTCLGVDRRATPTEIRRAFRARARATHPDVGGERRDFEAVVRAYEQLCPHAALASPARPAPMPAAYRSVLDGAATSTWSTYDDTPAPPRRRRQPAMGFADVLHEVIARGSPGSTSHRPAPD